MGNGPTLQLNVGSKQVWKRQLDLNTEDYPYDTGCGASAEIENKYSPEQEQSPTLLANVIDEKIVPREHNFRMIVRNFTYRNQGFQKELGVPVFVVEVVVLVDVFDVAVSLVVGFVEDVTEFVRKCQLSLDGQYTIRIIVFEHKNIQSFYYLQLLNKNIHCIHQYHRHRLMISKVLRCRNYAKSNQ